jgi:hypothetical protein
MKITNSLPEKFDEHLKLMAVLCESYDKSNDIVALSIATAIRVLVHDTKASTSLLTHLGKKTAKYLSTNFRDPKETVHLGLVRRINVGVNDGVGGEAKYWPLCDERYFPAPKQNLKSYLTRKDLVLSITNKDGGAHFDTEVDERYDDFRKSWSGRSCLVGRRSGMKRGYDNIPIYPAVRQVGYELLHSKL